MIRLFELTRENAFADRYRTTRRGDHIRQNGLETLDALQGRHSMRTSRIWMGDYSEERVQSESGVGEKVGELGNERTVGRTVAERDENDAGFLGKSAEAFSGRY